MLHYMEKGDCIIRTTNREFWNTWTLLPKKEGEEKYKEHCKKYLLALLKPGDSNVYCVLRHVSRSGMLRHIDFYVATNDYPLNVSHYVGELVGYKAAKNGALKVTGCGMDMGFSVVYNLGGVLFPDGFGVRSVDGYRPITRADAAACVTAGMIFHGRNGDQSGWDNSGGYALKAIWI